MSRLDEVLTRHQERLHMRIECESSSGGDKKTVLLFQS